MIRWILVIVCLLHATGAAAVDGIVLRTSVAPGDAWVGQRVRLYVEVLAADGWAQIADLRDIEIPGAYLVRTQTQGTRLNETINRVAWTGQRYEFSLFGQVAGRIEVPSLPVTVTVKRWGVADGDEVHEMHTPPTAFECRVPPGAEGVRGLVSTSRLTANQTWSSRPDTLDLGDAITRTVVLEAVNVSGMAFPPARHPEIEGVSIYPGQPVVEDESVRGTLDGKRVESVTYVFEKPGNYELPTVQLYWWNIDQSRLETIELAGIAVEVRGIPLLAQAELAEERGGFQWRWVVIAVGVFVLVLAVRVGVRRIRAWRRAYLESERHYFGLAMQSIRGGDARVISRALMHWLDRAETGRRPARMDLFLDEFGSEEARVAWMELGRCMVNGDRYASAGPLRAGLGQARRALKRTRKVQQVAAGVLPELNG